MSADSEHDLIPDSGHGDDLDLTAYALGQLDERQRAEVERTLAGANGDAAQIVAQTRLLAEKVREVLAADHPATSASLRETILHRLGESVSKDKPTLTDRPPSFWRRHAAELVAASLVVILLVALFLPPGQLARDASRRARSSNDLKQLTMKTHTFTEQDAAASRGEDALIFRYQESSSALEVDQQNIAKKTGDYRRKMKDATAAMTASSRSDPNFAGSNPSAGGSRGATPYFNQEQASAGGAKGSDGATALDFGGGQSGGGIPGGAMPGGRSGAGTAGEGQGYGLFAGVPPRTSKSGQGQSDDGWYYKSNGQVPQADGQSSHRWAKGMGVRPATDPSGAPSPSLDLRFQQGGDAFSRPQTGGFDADGPMPGGMFGASMPGMGPGSEQYATIVENAFITVQGLDALSTFSIDVDTASYANVRRFLNQSQLPPPDAVRIEELVNYFSYDYPQPKAGEPFSVNMETAECPWQPEHVLLRVGLKGREIHHKERPVSNLVFLLDVSGSMADENKLPLLKQVLSMMVRELREDDRVSIVTYAGEAGLRLPPTTGNEQAKILAAIDGLSAGGSTNGSAGIELAYDQAQSYFRPEGTNRVILATDGDLNVGITDDESLVKLIKQKATGGTFLTVLGFGEGNLKDAKMERLADNGNGLYAYIDSVREGRKVLIEQMSGSLVTIAKDVKVQIEFNPAQVRTYRLLGYENRMLTAPEFNDDRRDAGEIGAGHSVTALYELVPTGTQLAGNQPEETTLRYQAAERVQDSGFGVQEGKLTDAAASGELLTLKLRYKEPSGQASKLSEHPLKNRGGKFNAASKDFQFAAAVASFGMSLRNSQYRGEGTLAATAEIAAGAIGEDKGGYRAEFVDLVRKAQALGIK